MSYLDDPRVLFAAERTLLAWQRTALALMGFGFVIERSGLFLTLADPAQGVALDRAVSLWLGVLFLLMGAAVSLFSARQFRSVLGSLGPAEVPRGYRTHFGVVVNVVIALLGLALATHFVLRA